MNIVGQKIVRAELSGRPGRIAATLIELDDDVVLYGKMRIVRKSQGICIKCGELIPQGCCNCGPEQQLVTLDLTLDRHWGGLSSWCFCHRLTSSSPGG